MSSRPARRSWNRPPRQGILTRLINAGAFISSSSCDYCFGRMGVMRAGQRAVSTGTLNVRGRMGSPDSEIYHRQRRRRRGLGHRGPDRRSAALPEGRLTWRWRTSRAASRGSSRTRISTSTRSSASRTSRSRTPPNWPAVHGRRGSRFRDQKVQPGDLLVGNHNFGYGHPHYPPMIGMRHLGIAGVIAESFSPGYWRGEIAMGFPQVICPGISAPSAAGTRSRSTGLRRGCAT
jgi:hypothetical protein